jgi:hypothetical protein
MTPAASMFVQHLSGKPLAETADGYYFRYRQTPDGLNVTAEQGSDRVSAPVVWIFGSGRQAQTPVVQYHGRFIEHHVSLYVSTGYGITIGHENGLSASAERALGLALSDADAKTCFGCHATDISQDLTRLTPGIGCIRCHAGAEEHAKGHGKPVNPGKLGHVAQVQLCGTCHRLQAPAGSESDIANVRFQPFRMMQSACFLKGEIACTTCHAAHSDARKDAANFYNQQCVNCHANKARHIATEKSGDCIACHMPKVSPAPAFIFTDHFIRIVSSPKRSPKLP